MKKKLEKLQILMNILKKSGQVLAARRKGEFLCGRNLYFYWVVY